MTIPPQKFNSLKSNGFLKNPFFYFGFAIVLLFGLLFFSKDSLAQLGGISRGDTAFFSPFFNSRSASNELFFDQNTTVALETPDLKIIQDNSLYGVSTPYIFTTQTLGALLGGGSSSDEKKEIIDYSVRPGDTPMSIAQHFDISLNTLLWANPDVTKATNLKVGQSLVIPPVDGVVYIVKSGDTISEIARKYKSTTEKIIAFSGLKDEGDIFPEDVIFLPDGQMPQKSAPLIINAPLADSFFILPTQGTVSQGPHGVGGRGVDIANKCGTPVFAAAAGTVQRAQFNLAYGNFITIDHHNGVLTYSGHLQALNVKPGERVTTGQIIGLMGRTGTFATGCHLHFEVRGARNFLSKYGIGAKVSFK